jgi:PKD repeat protein
MTLTTAGVLSGTPTATGTFNFTVSVTDASGCTGSLNYGITVNCPSNPISFSAFPAVCTSGAPVTMDQASPAGGTYSGVNVNAGAFNPSAGSQSITYDYTDAFGCAFSATQTFDVNPTPNTPTITATGSTTFCEGDSVILTSSYATGNSWSGGQNTASITVYDSGFYTVTYTDGNGCPSAPSAATTVIVNTVPAAPVITPSGSTTICEGSSITLSSSAAAGNSWSTGETTQTITVSGAGTFTVNTTENGCTSEESASITTTANPLPVAAFTVGGTSPSFTFTSTSTNASGVSWNFGDGSPANTNATATHTYTTNGTFTVTLTATNACGTDTETGNVTVFGIGINESTGLENVHIFPNPTDALLTISFRTDSPKEMVLTIVDGLGKTISVQTLGTVTQEFSQQLDVTHLAPGVYLISLESADGSKAVKRFVKH